MPRDSNVEVLSPDDANDVEALRAASNDTLGFMALSVMKGYLRQRGGIGIWGDEGLRAYALFAAHRHHVRLIHLCVIDQYRRSGYAGRLLQAVVGAAKERGVGTVKLTCRRDYTAANAFWRGHGFIPLREAAAKTSGARLMTWYLGIDGAAQQDIFLSVTSDDKVKAVIDAQIFFQLHASESDEASIAKGLQADFLAGTLELYIAKEVFNEIDRAELEQRTRSRDFALAFPHQLNHSADKMPPVVERLKGVLPTGRDSDESDIRQLAMTATSDVSIFLTRDERILSRATQIKRTVSVNVMHPDELIVRLDQFTDREAYHPVAVSGSNLGWRRVGGDDVAKFRSGDDLLGPHERKWRFKNQLDKALSHPKIWRTEALWSDGALVALRSLRSDGCRLVAALCRASRGRTQEMFTEYAAASLIHEAVTRGALAVEVELHGVAPEAIKQLVRLGFVSVGDKLVRMCPAAVMSEFELREVAGAGFDSMDSEELEKQCSPVVLRTRDKTNTMI